MGSQNMVEATPKLVTAGIATVLIVVGCVAAFTIHNDNSSSSSAPSQLPANAGPASAATQLSVLNPSGNTCTTISSIDIDKFDGVWYQVINNRYTTIFGGGTSCTGTVYDKTSDTAVAVQNGNVNNCNTSATTMGTCDDFTSSINGTAEVADSSEPGQLTLTLYTPFLF